MTESKVSVVIPAYNRRAYITEAVDSVLNQTWPSVELIVVDDGSTDGTWELLQGYGDRITLLSHPNRENRGQSAAINVGLRHVTGEYVAILDSDDYWPLEKLAVMVGYLQANPDVGLVYSNGICSDAQGNRIYDFLPKNHVEPNDPNAILLDCYTCLPSNSLVRKIVFDNVGGFEESFRAAQDHDMLIRMAEVTRFAYIPEYLFFYRRHGESISATGQERRWRNGFTILERAKSRYPYRASTVRKRRALLHYRLGECFWRAGQRLKALPRFVIAGLLDPVRAVRVLAGVDRAVR